MVTATVTSWAVCPSRVAMEEENRSSMASMSAVHRLMESPAGVWSW